MTIEISWRMVMFVSVIVGYLLATHWTDRIRHLRLTYFRPWRGDTWPHGVQEETETHWRFTPPASPSTPTAAGGGRGDGGAPTGDGPSRGSADADHESPSDTLLVPVGPVGGVHVDRPHHA